ncbi:MAG: hypothetical protein H3C59_06475 [Burkholderiaceae bacterium]|nr:hypothetical protein [Burkholderiaceae bacterium]MCD6671747.1 hypothetical protein [Burkholderiaceae bacterium]
MNENTDPLRLEIAAAAARLLADGATDYASAKRKAAQRVLGERSAPKGSMPDNEEVDAALLEHLELFDAGHAERVLRRRRTAAELMQRLEEYQPYLTGAVWKGIVTEHAPIHLQLFHDNTKDVQIDLLNSGVDFDVGSMPHFRGGPDVEAITFWMADAPVLLSLYRHDDLRGALKGGRNSDAGPERGDRRALLGRLGEAA